MESKKQEKGLGRNTIDKFYTSPDTVELCIDLIRKHLSISKTDLIIEPSSGNGSFIESIKKFPSEYKFYDLEPENPEITKQDFLSFDYSCLKKYNQIHLIGNPPFGRQSSLAIKFIKKCCEFANTISFILPKSFKKESMQKYFSLDFMLITEFDLPKNSFLVDGRTYNVPCVFQIWEKQIKPRVLAIKKILLKFQFIDAKQADISFRRVGIYAGKIDTNLNKNVQSHYFIKFTNSDTIENNINKLSTVTFCDKDSTVGPKSISKQELIKEFNKVL